MKIILYNPNSKGGNYDYALKLVDAYGKDHDVQDVQLVLPANAPVVTSEQYKKILLSDKPPVANSFGSRVYFLWRSLINPLKFYAFLKGGKGYVIFNDFDQVSSFIWVPLFRRLKKKYVFSVILHDPDRDKYFKIQALSNISMRLLMSVMDVAFYHEMLPARAYYSGTKTRYVPIPHGLYEQDRNHALNGDFARRLREFKGNGLLAGALGNIRNEKNYPLIISALKHVQGLKLLITGIPANSSVKMSDYARLIEKEGLQDRVLIIERYLEAQALMVAAEQCDAFILYYADSFKSHSGMLNFLAPFKKPLLVSRNDSPLSALVARFNLGLLAPPDSREELVKMLNAFTEDGGPKADWNGYFSYSSWENHVAIAVDVLKKIER